MKIVEISAVNMWNYIKASQNAFLMIAVLFVCLLKGYSTFFGNRLILPLPQSETVGFYRFWIYSDDFFYIFRRVTRQFLVSLTSILSFTWHEGVQDGTLYLLTTQWFSFHLIRSFWNANLFVERDLTALSVNSILYLCRQDWEGRT